MTNINRRNFVKSIGCAGAAATLAMPSVGWSEGTAGSNEKTMIMLNLRGGLDALATLGMADSSYASLRGMQAILAPNSPSAPAGRTGLQLGVDDRFFLNPMMPDVKTMFDLGEANIYMDVGMAPNNLANEDHFSMENFIYGGMGIYNPTSGFLNRATNAVRNRMDPTAGLFEVDSTPGFSPIDLGTVPVMHYQPTGNSALMNDSAMQLVISSLYMGDNILGAAYANGVRTRNTLGSLLGTAGHTDPATIGSLHSGAAVANIVGLIASAPAGSRPAFIYTNMVGFDMHDVAVHGTLNPSGYLNAIGQRLDQVNIFLRELKRILVANGVWNKVLIVVFSEFGRRIANNQNPNPSPGVAATVGSDHGRGGIMFTISGDSRHRVDAPNGRRVIAGTWNGIGHADSRGNMPATMDGMRLIRNHMGLHFGMTAAELDAILPVTAGGSNA